MEIGFLYIFCHHLSGMTYDTFEFHRRALKNTAYINYLSIK